MSESRSSDFKIIRSLASGSQHEEAIRLLKEKVAQASDAETKNLANFALGVLSYEAGDDVQSQKALGEALQSGTRLEDFARYYLGLSLNRTGNSKDAKKELQKVLAFKPTSQRAMDAKLVLGEIALAEKNFREARTHFAYLERKTRRTPKYSAVTLDLIRAERGLRNPSGVCRWMRQLYTKYPGDPMLANWGVDLHKIQLDDFKPGCIAGPNDLKTRIRNLQHAGQSARARAEIETLQARAREFTKSFVDQIMANFLINEGDVESAFKLLSPYYEAHKSDYGYLMLLGKAAARAGEYQAASGSYYRAYQMTPKSRKGREALFQAAFLSYQNNDYDGASKKFSDFVKLFGGSGLSRDSQWYMAWIDYLKEDFDGAYSKFSQLGKMRGRRRQTYSQDRVDYWRAMSLMKAGRIEDSRRIFEQVASDKLHGYYALAAQARLELLKQEDSKKLASNKRDPASVDLPRVGSPRPLTDSIVPLEPPPSTENESGEVVVTEPPKTEEDEAESGLRLSEDEADTTEEAPAEGPEEVAAAEGEEPLKTSFQDPRLAARFKRASDLHLIGFQEWARWELYEIEKRTRNREYLKMLMAEYETNQAYHRSSSIAQIEFGPQRSRLGFDGARYLWQYSYPKAFEKTVSNFARGFRIPQELVWSIMRAESRYKPDVISPVGAMGLMQLMPYTGEKIAQMLEVSGFSPGQLLDPELNIRLGARYLQRLHDKMNGQIPLIAASYNAGPHRVAAWLRSFGRLDMDEFVEHVPFIETRNYVKKVVHNYYVYSSLYAKNSKPLMWLTQPPGVEIQGPLPTRESWE